MSDSPIIGITEPFPEAPNDGVQYGRQSESWTAIENPSEGSPEEEVSQPAHGFSVGHCIRWNGTAYVLAIADSDETTALGLVVSVAGVDDFTWAMSGIFDIGTHGLTADEWYFLSDTVAGELVSVAPAIEQPIVYAKDATTIAVYPYRPTGDIGGEYITEAPIDGTPYNRKDAAWTRAETPVGEAPVNGKIYGRQNLAWSEILGVAVVNYTSDDTSDALLTVQEAWNSYGNRIPVERGTNEIIFFNWPSTSSDNYQYTGNQLVAPWTSTANDWVNIGGGTVSWGSITGDINTQTDLSNALGAKGAVGIDYTFLNDTVASDPLNGNMKINDADPALATELYVSANSGGGNSLTRFWNGFQVGDLIKVLEVGGNFSFTSYEITSSPVNNTSWYTVGITALENIGGAMANGDHAQVYWSSDPRSTVREGGTAGQLLAKTDGNDYQIGWVDPPQGVSFLRDLEDVAVDAPPAINDFLRWDGADWVNVPYAVTDPDGTYYWTGSHHHSSYQYVVGDFGGLIHETNPNVRMVITGTGEIFLDCFNDTAEDAVSLAIRPNGPTATNQTAFRADGVVSMPNPVKDTPDQTDLPNALVTLNWAEYLVDTHANNVANPHAVTAAQVGAAPVSHTHDAADLPATMPPSAHTHDAADLPTVLVGLTSIEVVATLPATPVATTFYIVTG